MRSVSSEFRKASMGSPRMLGADGSGPPIAVCPRAAMAGKVGRPSGADERQDIYRRIYQILTDDAPWIPVMRHTGLEPARDAPTRPADRTPMTR